MKPEDPHRQVQRHASVLAIVSSYFAIRESLQLPKFHHLLVGLDDEPQHFSAGKSILEHPHLLLALVIATLLAIWKPFRYHQVIYLMGIALQFFLFDRAVASILDPVVRAISIMSSQSRLPRIPPHRTSRFALAMLTPYRFA